MSNPFTLQQGAVSYSDTSASPVADVNITGVQKVSFTGNKVDFSDITNINSPGDYREFFPTLLEAGECSFSCVYFNDSIQKGVLTLRDNKSLRTWSVTDENNIFTATFDAYVESCDSTEDLGKTGELTVKLKITGKMTIS